MSKFKDKPVASVSALLKHMKADVPAGQLIWFRGHDDIEWKLEPSLNRQKFKDPFESGVQLYKKFIQEASKLLPAAQREEHEWLFYMQHYGLPTHLLDWSESPLVALYFAVQDASFDHKDGALYLLDPVEFNNSANHRKLGNKDIFSFGIDPEASEYLMTKLNQTNKNMKSVPIALMGAKNSERIQAQEGVFIAHHRDMNWMTDEFKSADCTWGWRYKIPASSKKDIKRELSLLMMDYFTVYPQLDMLARRIKERMQ